MFNIVSEVWPKILKSKWGGGAICTIFEIIFVK
jgi:hypothetical protein